MCKIVLHVWTILLHFSQWNVTLRENARWAAGKFASSYYTDIKSNYYDLKKYTMLRYRDSIPMPPQRYYRLGHPTELSEWRWKVNRFLKTKDTFPECWPQPNALTQSVGKKTLLFIVVGKNDLGSSCTFCNIWLQKMQDLGCCVFRNIFNFWVIVVFWTSLQNVGLSQLYLFITSSVFLRPNWFI